MATLARAVRKALPSAEACALGLEFLAERCGSDVAQVEAMLIEHGMRIYKGLVPFRGERVQAVSVNKKLKTWAKQEGA